MGFIDLWIDKTVFVRLNSNNLVFSGKILDIVFMGKDIQDVDIYMVTMRDKFGMLQTFSSKEIALLQEKE